MIVMIMTSIEFWSSWKYNHGGVDCINANAVDVDDVDVVDASILNDACYLYYMFY